MAGTTRCVIATTDNRLSSMAVEYAARSVVANVARWRTAGVGDQNVDITERLGRLIGEGDRAIGAYRRRRRSGLASPGSERAAASMRSRSRLQISDSCALRRERPGRGKPQTCGCTGDSRRSPFETQVHDSRT